MAGGQVASLSFLQCEDEFAATTLNSLHEGVFGLRDNFVVDWEPTPVLNDPIDPQYSQYTNNQHTPSHYAQSVRTPSYYSQRYPDAYAPNQHPCSTRQPDAPQTRPPAPTTHYDTAAAAAMEVPSSAPATEQPTSVRPQMCASTPTSRLSVTARPNGELIKVAYELNSFDNHRLSSAS